jgi:hypothetical protein
LVAERLTSRCAAESRGRDEPLHGTASRVRRWVLVEQPGAWGREALTESRLDELVGQQLRSVSRRLGVRVLLVRLPQRETSAEGTGRVYLAHTGPERSWIEQLDVADAGEIPRLDLGALASEEPPGIGSPGPEMVTLVCTNGKHDPCCADLGRPVVRALQAAAAPDVWESSHVGGDRFAANVVCLPLGVYFGRVEPDGAEAMLAELRAGRIDLDHYRGRSCFPPLVQSAEVFARRELDEPGVDALRVVASEPGEGALAVRLSHQSGSTVEVVVARERTDEVPLTCHGGPGRPWRYVLRSLEVHEG